MDLWCVRTLMDLQFFCFQSSLSTGNATKLNVSRNKVASESNDALSYVLNRAFQVNVVQERYQWWRYGWRNVFIVAFINLSQQTVLIHDYYKLPYTEICKTYEQTYSTYQTSKSIVCVYFALMFLYIFLFQWYKDYRLQPNKSWRFTCMAYRGMMRRPSARIMADPCWR